MCLLAGGMARLAHVVNDVLAEGGTFELGGVIHDLLSGWFLLESAAPKSGQLFFGSGLHQAVPFLARQPQVGRLCGIANVLGVGATDDWHNTGRVS